jgi:hypothetical protein
MHALTKLACLTQLRRPVPIPSPTVALPESPVGAVLRYHRSRSVTRTYVRLTSCNYSERRITQ